MTDHPTVQAAALAAFRERAVALRTPAPGCWHPTGRDFAYMLDMWADEIEGASRD